MSKMLFKRWKEVYNTSDMEKLFTAKNRLSMQNIRYRTETIDNSLRLSQSRIRSTPVLNRGGGVANYYKLLVQEADECEARFLLSNL